LRVILPFHCRRGSFQKQHIPSPGRDVTAIISRIFENATAAMELGINRRSCPDFFFDGYGF